MSEYLATAVIGAGFGDEGKGITVDKICEDMDNTETMVVRHSGGAQAGHTVVRKYEVIDEAKDEVVEKTIRHVFHHFGSGTLQGIPTLLGRRFVSNPILWRRERRELVKIMAKVAEYEEIEDRRLPQLYADPRGLVTTHVDMLINEMIEFKRQKDGNHHGSVGVGINETMVRSDNGPRLLVNDLINGTHADKGFLNDLREWAVVRMAYYGLTQDDDPQRYEWLTSDAIEAAWLTDCDSYAKTVEKMIPEACERHVVFEGAQGLLLDKDNHKFFPHLTNAYTGMRNAMEWLDESTDHHLDKVYYVTRPYMTRHGAGPFPTEDPELEYHDETNRPATFQGSLRFGKWDEALVSEAVTRDINHVVGQLKYQDDEDWNALQFHFSVTHRDQVTDDEFARVIRGVQNMGLDSGLVSAGPATSDMAA